MRWDAADLLEQLLDLTGRPAADEQLPREKAYRYLTLGQDYWLEQLALHVPEAMWGAPEQLTTPDGGLTYELAQEPVGMVYLFADRLGTPLNTGPEGSPETDYVPEGQIIRMAGGAPRTFRDGPYARYIAAPEFAVGGGAQEQPIIRPLRARRLIVLHAAVLFGNQGGGIRDPNLYYNLEQEAWSGRPDDPSDGGLLASLKRQYQSNYGGGSGRRWYHSPDLA